jgi:Zn-dependent protease
MIDTRTGTLKLFRFAGIQVFLHWSWFLIALIRIPSFLGRDVTLPAAIAIYVTLFAIVLLHEFGHSLACRQVGGQTHDIILWPLGGIAFVSPPPRPGATLWSIAAGPLVNVALVPVLYLLARATAMTGLMDQFPGLVAYWRVVQAINIGLLIFNVIPVYPLDGGQILQSLLWFPFGRVRSLQIAAWIGLVGVAGFVVLAIFQGDLWLGFIALFLGQRCWIGLREARVISALQQLPRHTGFACPTCHTAPPGGPLWGCRACGNRFDPFSTNAICPHCGTAQANTPCPHCGSAHPIASWRTSAEPPVIDV